MSKNLHISKNCCTFAAQKQDIMDYQYHIFSPYRVCPLGAHVDHQHGLVTGFAIDKGVIQGSLPVGGSSSSAAVLIAYVMAFAKANDITLQPFEVLKIASKAERDFGFTPKITLREGLRQFAEWYKAYYNPSSK